MVECEFTGVKWIANGKSIFMHEFWAFFFPLKLTRLQTSEKKGSTVRIHTYIFYLIVEIVLSISFARDTFHRAYGFFMRLHTLHLYLMSPFPYSFSVHIPQQFPYTGLALTFWTFAKHSIYHRVEFSGITAKIQIENKSHIVSATFMHKIIEFGT